jgi:hypothetical protein
MKIIYTSSKGQCCVVHPVINTHTVVDGDVVPIPENITAQQALERSMLDVPSDAIDVQIVDDTQIPADRTFRGGWKVSQGKVEHDIQKCKTIAHDMRRAKRTTELSPLDIEATIPAKAAHAEAARQAIRDKYAGIQAAIDAADTVEQLKAELS